MKRSVGWSSTALDDLDDQVAHIAEDDPRAARKVRDRIDAAARGLSEIPTGRPGRMRGTYEKTVTGLPYILAYAITLEGGAETVTILHVIHTSRDWSEGRWPS